MIKERVDSAVSKDQKAEEAVADTGMEAMIRGDPIPLLGMTPLHGNLTLQRGIIQKSNNLGTLKETIIMVTTMLGIRTRGIHQMTTSLLVIPKHGTLILGA
jgi:hypothetical protein